MPPAASLSHLRVLDLSRILAGPWASQILGDLGADVIKVERPGLGDDTRTWGPPFLESENAGSAHESAYFLSANRNKRSIAVDFTRSEGQAIIRQLAAQSDILIENFKQGGLAKYRLDHASLAEVNPRLIYCSITGFGQTGPYSSRAGYDALLQAIGGYMGITGRQAGTPGAGPQKIGVAVIDLLSGLYAAIGVLAALAAREQTGSGQYIDLALLDVEVACLANQAMNYLVTGQSPECMGNAHPSIVPYQDFSTADGSLMIAVGNDAQFERFCRALGCAELATDPDYRTNAARVAHRKGLILQIESFTRTRSTAEWVAVFAAVQVPCGPVNTIEDVFNDQQVKHRQLELSLPHPLLGRVPSVASPLRLSKTPVQYRLPPPVLGQHTEEVLRGNLGFSEEKIAGLRDLGIIR